MCSRRSPIGRRCRRRYHRPCVRSLRRSLQKDPARRLRDIADARFQIEEVLNGPADACGGACSPAGRTNERMLWVAALIAVAAVAAALAWTLRPRAEAGGGSPRNRHAADDATDLVGRVAGRPAAGLRRQRPRSVAALWLRPLDSAAARPLAGTENARFPFWSPDGRSVGFAADDQLKRVDVESGSVRVVASGGALAGTWNRDGTILFHPAPGGGLFRVSADGGDPQPATRINLRRTTTCIRNSCRTIAISVLFDRYRAGHLPRCAGHAGTAAAARRRRRRDLRRGVGTSAVRPRRHVVRAGLRSGAARAGRQSRRRSGTDRRQRGGRRRCRRRRRGRSSIEPDRRASSTSSCGSTGPAPWWKQSPAPTSAMRFNASLSHDGRRLAMERVVGTTDIWTLDVRRGVPERLTTRPGFRSGSGVVTGRSPDRLHHEPEGAVRLGAIRRPASSNGDDELLVAAGADTTSPTDWSPDGRVILYALAILRRQARHLGGAA